MLHAQTGFATLRKVEDLQLLLQLASQIFVALQVAEKGCYRRNFLRQPSSQWRCVAGCRENCIVLCSVPLNMGAYQPGAGLKGGVLRLLKSEEGLSQLLTS